jgi:transposase
VGVHTKIYAGFSATDDHSIGELSFFPSVIAQTHVNCPSMETMLGDSLYATRQACAIVAGYGARPYFLPKTTSTLRSHGVPAWKEMTYELVKDPQGWLEAYHMRSISETVNSMDKTRFPAKIRKRLYWRKRTEELLRKDVHNVRQYSYLRYLEPDLVRPMAG